MQLFNASSLLYVNIEEEIINLKKNPDELRNRLINGKRELLKLYNLSSYNLPDDFTHSSYIIAANHLTDTDAPLIMSYYYEVMHRVTATYPELFVFAKENCFNGVSIPQELTPVLELEKVFAVDRNSSSGSLSAIRAAEKWYNQGEKPKHFLIFSQGTIYDINKEKSEDIERGTFWLAKLLGIPVLPTFIEQAVEGEINRIVFGKPIFVPKTCRNFDEIKQLWIDRVIEAQDELTALTGIPARQAVLDKDHQIRKRFIKST